MSMMDKLKGMLKGHEDKAGQAVDKAGDVVDEKTQGKYSRHVDTAQDRLKRQMGGGTTEQPPPPQPHRPPQQ
ncbi:antitoxin [Streptomyces sp. NPDC003327]